MKKSEQDIIAEAIESFVNEDVAWDSKPHIKADEPESQNHSDLIVRRKSYDPSNSKTKSPLYGLLNTKDNKQLATLQGNPSLPTKIDVHQKREDGAQRLIGVIHKKPVLDAAEQPTGKFTFHTKAIHLSGEKDHLGMAVTKSVNIGKYSSENDALSALKNHHQEIKHKGSLLHVEQ